MSENTIRIAVLGTLDTKGDEIAFLKAQIAARGATPLVIDLGVLGTPTLAADYTRQQVAQAGGIPLDDLLPTATRETAGPIMVRGASRILEQLVQAQGVQGAIALGGTQGTSQACQIMQTLPYGFPKLMVSTCAAGDTRPFIGVKDISMMFSVSDILGLNPFMRRVLENAAGAICGMAAGSATSHPMRPSPMIAISNLGVLTAGAMLARDYLEKHGYEVIIFHAVGAGGRAMEQMMSDGLILGVFDYALGDIADDVFGALRASGPERLRTAAQLGLPQVICPGGTEHLGVFLKSPFELPEEYRSRLNVFHSPIIAAPRLSPEELTRVAQEIGQRLVGVQGQAAFMIPLRGVSRYSVPGGPLHDPHGDGVYFAALKRYLPERVEIFEVDAEAEMPAFIHACCDKLLGMLSQRSAVTSAARGK